MASDVLLLNTPAIEIWPGRLLQARSNHDARLLARATQVLRRKRDGRYLAALTPEGLRALVPNLQREPGLTAAQATLEHAHRTQRAGIERLAELPLSQLRERLDALGLDDGYGARVGLPLVA